MSESSPSPENDALDYCGTELGETPEGDCECPRHAYPDPLQDWPMPGYVKPDPSIPPG